MKHSKFSLNTFTFGNYLLISQPSRNAFEYETNMHLFPEITYFL